MDELFKLIAAGGDGATLLIAFVLWKQNDRLNALSESIVKVKAKMDYWWQVEQQRVKRGETGH